MANNKTAQIRFLAVCFILGFMLPLSAQSTEEILAQAQSLARQQHFDQAYALYAQLAEVQPKDVAARLGLATTLGYSGHLAEACLRLTELLAEQPTNTEIVAYLARFYRWDNQLAKAHQLVVPALAAAPQQPDLLYEMGELYYSERQWAQAAACFRQILNLNPTFEEAKTALAKSNAAASAHLIFQQRYFSTFDLEGAINNQEKQNTILDFKGGYSKALNANFTLSAFVFGNRLLQNDFLKNSQDFSLNSGLIGGDLTYWLNSGLSLQIGGQLQQFSDLGSKYALQTSALPLTFSGALCWRPNQNSFKVYFGEEYFPLLRGAKTQIFSLRSLGLLAESDLTNSLRLGLDLADTYATSFAGHRPYLGTYLIYTGWQPLLSLRYRHRYQAAPDEYTQALQLINEQQPWSQLRTQIAYELETNSLKNNLRHTFMLNNNWRFQPDSALLIAVSWSTEKIADRYWPNFAINTTLQLPL